MKPIAFNYTDSINNVSLSLPITAFKKPENEADYVQLQGMLNQLIDTVRDNEKHPLAIAMQIIGENLEQYDDEDYPNQMGVNISNIDMVKHLMQANKMTQKDLSQIFGSQGNVSKFLNGERELSKKQIAGLKNLFSISSDAFM